MWLSQEITLIESNTCEVSMSKERQGGQDHSNTQLKDQGRGQKESKERQPLPSVWDFLLSENNISKEGIRLGNLMDFFKESDWRREEFEKKASPRDKHILALLSTPRPSLLNAIRSEQERIQEWRSLVEKLSDEEISECARKQKEEIEAFRRGDIPILSFHPSVGDGELILAKHIAKKGKSG
jgi:hypothetical protein